MFGIMTYQKIAAYLFMDHICNVSTELFYKWLEEEAENIMGWDYLSNYTN